MISNALSILRHKILCLILNIVCFKQNKNNTDEYKFRSNLLGYNNKFILTHYQIFLSNSEVN